MSEQKSSRPSIATRLMWTCPTCGNQFVSRNLRHSCIVVPMDTHFEGRPRARELFDAYLAAVQSFGSVTVVSSKMRIAFMTRVRFAGCQVRRNWLLAHFWLVRRIESPRFTKVETLGPRVWLYSFALRDESDIDAEFISWLAHARLIGDQEHVGGVLDLQPSGNPQTIVNMPFQEGPCSTRIGQRRGSEDSAT